MGRKQKPYQTSWKDIIPGLARDTNGRWRITATGFRYSEPNERRAVERFYQITGTKREPEMVKMSCSVGAISPVPFATVVGETPEAIAANGLRLMRATRDFPGRIEMNLDQPPAEWQASFMAPGSVVWAWLGELLDTDPAFVARMVNRPALANLHTMPTPAKSLTLNAIVENYQTHGTAGDKSKGRAVKVFNELVEQTGARTLEDLTTEKLMGFKQWVQTNPKRKKGSYRTWYFGCIKSIIGFGLKTGLDATQIGAALTRCKVLWSSVTSTVANPTPISRDELHELLKHASPIWRAMILVGLNLCLHLEEVCALEWITLDLKNKTYSTIRFKTKENRIARAAVLWDETIEALKNLPRKGPKYVFTSTHGTRYNREARGNHFKQRVVNKSLVNPEISFDWIKDGSYTAAINDPEVEERFARVMAGHKSMGDQDKYVLRNPRCTAGACAAVYREYAPFPAQPALTKRQKAGLKLPELVSV